MPSPPLPSPPLPSPPLPSPPLPSPPLPSPPLPCRRQQWQCPGCCCKGCQRPEGRSAMRGHLTRLHQELPVSGSMWSVWSVWSVGGCGVCGGCVECGGVGRGDGGWSVGVFMHAYLCMCLCLCTFLSVCMPASKLLLADSITYLCKPVTLCVHL